MTDLLKPAFAGSFYPSNPTELRTLLHKLLDNSCEPQPEAIGMVAPHAGYIYSGITAGYGFASAPDSVSTVVVCAPSHRNSFYGETVFDIDFVETPLGLCSVNKDVTTILAEEMHTVVFNEHSFEVMVPFIQTRWPEASIVPVVLGIEPDCEKVAQLIHSNSPDAFFIASSDLSHFYPLDEAEKLDRVVINSFLSLSPDRFTSDLQACGKDPIKALLHFAKLCNVREAKELHYSTSADAGAGRSEVVGYFSGMVL